MSNEPIFITKPDTLPADLFVGFKELFSNCSNPIEYESGDWFDVYQIINNRKQRTNKAAALYEVGRMFLQAKCKNPTQGLYEAKLDPSSYTKEAVKKGVKGFIPKTLQPVVYVDQFNSLANSKGLSKAGTIRFLLDYYFNPTFK